MTSPIDNTGAKRKRSPSDNAGQPHNPQHQIPQHLMSAQPGNPTVFPQINYLVSNHKKLKLMEGDSETFKDVLAMIDDYEGVLKRHESLAANLGAKLVGTLLLKSFDKMFHGDIQVIHSSFGLEQSPATWLDLVTLARSNPVDFFLSDSVSGLACRVYLKGGQVQISEDDYRLIMSGAPERMIPSQTIPEDEAAELGTLSILEARLAVLIKKADVVASKARQLNYHLGKHKTAVQGRSSSVAGGSGFGQNSPGHLSHSPFQHDTTKLQQELLKQYTANDNRPLSGHKSARASLSAPQDIQRARSASNNPIDPRDQNNHHRNSPSISTQGARDDYRAMMTSKIEKLPRGDPINPPCDRCRRLKFHCTKNLTACTACTKKHAKCSWNDITEEELTIVQRGSNGMDLFVNMNTNGNTNGNGHVNPAVNMDANLDPNLRTSNLAAVLADQEFPNHNTAAVAQMESLGCS